MPSAIIFDLDNTIITWKAASTELWGDICRRLAPGNGLDAATLHEAITTSLHWYWGDPERHRRGRTNLYATRRIIVGMAMQQLGIEAPDLAREITDTFNTEQEAAAIVVPEAIGTLEQLRGKGIRLAMITNGASDLQRAKLHRFGLLPFFESILIEGEFGPGKPDSRVFTYTMEKLDVPAAETWMVGDDLKRDIAPCRPLGIYSIWVDGEGQGLPLSGDARPDRVIKKISELLDFA